MEYLARNRFPFHETPLTSAGVKNQSINDALVELLGKPIAESDALLIPTASYGHASWAGAYRFIHGVATTPMSELGWKSLAVLELSALPTLPRDYWVPAVESTDILLVNGGDAVYLSYWVRESGLVDLIPTLANTVWMGLSAGSMVMTPKIGADFMQWPVPGGSDGRRRRRLHDLPPPGSPGIAREHHG